MENACFETAVTWGLCPVFALVTGKLRAKRSSHTFKFGFYSSKTLSGLVYYKFTFILTRQLNMCSPHILTKRRWHID